MKEILRIGVRTSMSKQPNLVYVFSDQHRFDAVGFMGNPDVQTPVMDSLSEQSIHFQHALANSPVCGPSRACLMTGKRSLNTGFFVNDICLDPDAQSIGKLFKGAGYATGYIGKWHLDGNGLLNYIPRERRHGFDFWKSLECTHNYNNSYYYGDEPVKLKWGGYDAEAQTECAIEYIRNHDRKQPFALFLSWGPPHSPYHTAPQKFRELYDPESITLRPNVPQEWQAQAREMIAGYYAHVSALDELLGRIWQTLKEENIENDTVFIYTSDHGDMLGSHGQLNKQRPWDESIRVPFLMRCPGIFGDKSKHVTTPFSTLDIMPTLLDLCGIDIPMDVEGVSFVPFLKEQSEAPVDAALIECVHPFGQYIRRLGGKEYRGIRTDRFTYVKDLQGPWLLYDNLEDPYQMNNLIGSPQGNELLASLDPKLQDMLDRYGDEFLHGDNYVQRWGYTVDEDGTVPYSGFDPDGE